MISFRWDVCLHFMVGRVHPSVPSDINIMFSKVHSEMVSH
jgi:hypothetical protein